MVIFVNGGGEVKLCFGYLDAFCNYRYMTNGGTSTSSTSTTSMEGMVKTAKEVATIMADALQVSGWVGKAEMTLSPPRLLFDPPQRCR